MKLVKHPDVFLKQDTHEIKFPLDILNKKLIADMVQAMYNNDGIGLAANQIGYNAKIFVMDVSNEKNNPQIFINPVIEKLAKEKLTEGEGCLSCPGKFIDVRRSTYIGLSWFCEHGKKQYKTFYNFPAKVVQHEMDHLNGKLIIDYEKGG